MSTAEPPPVREWPFPVAIALVLLGLIVAYRCATGVGIGFLPAQPPDGPVPLGIIQNPHDNLMYLSWARQSAEGAWLFEDRYALEEHPAVFFNPYFLAVGKVARWFDLPPLAVMFLSGLLAVPVVVVSSYWIARAVGLTITAARWATVLVAFSSGVSYPLQWLWALAGGTFPELLLGADQRYVDALFFPTFFVYPYITVAYALMGLTLLVALRCDAAEPGRRAGWLLLLGMLTLLLGFTHPYEHVMLLVSFAGLAGWDALAESTRPRAWRRLPVLAVMALGSGTVVAYFLWLASHPVWDYVARVSARVPFDPVIWITGWGLLLPLASFGTAAVLRVPELERSRWFIVWLAALLVLLIALNVPQTKVSAGGHLPLCVLSGVALAQVIPQLLRPRGLVRTAMGWAALMLLAVGLFGSALGFLVAQLGADVRIDGNLLAVAQTIPPRSRIVCDYRDADMLVPLAGVRTFCGNHYKTPDWAKKRDRQALCGTDPDVPADALNDTIRRRMLAELLAEQHIEFLLLRHSVAAYTDISKIPGVQLVATRGEWSVYRVEPAAGDRE